MKDSLHQIKKLFEQGENIIRYLKNENNTNLNTKEMIMISYDFQSGTYIKNTKNNPDYYQNYTQAVAKVINKLNVNYNSILEAGVGEATTLANLIPKLEIKPQSVYGFDLAWSRLRYGKEYLNQKNVDNTTLFMADLFNIPLADNSIDIVYTSHSIEPNNGKEKEALLELFRITNKYLILLEPSFEFATDEGRKRMEEHGYIKNLYETATSLGLNIIEHRLFDVYANPLNPTGLLIIEKNIHNLNCDNPIICPITKTPLELIKNSYYTKEGLLVYPIIDGIPCLLEDNAVIASHYLDNWDNV